MNNVKYGDILSPGTPEEQRKQEDRVRKRFWPTLKKAIRQMPFGEDAVAAYYCAMDPQTPTKVRGILLAALAYFVMPADVIPDFIAVVGFSDDLAVLSLAISSVRSHLRVSHYEAARRALSDDAQA